MSDPRTNVCLLVSVGGTPNPIAYAIDHHRPQTVIFFASRDSRGEIESRVRPLTSHRWLDQEVITTPDPQDLVVCMESLVTGIPAALANLKMAGAQLIVDYTGGTKTMSAALVLATINETVRYSYVGGTVRAKEGLGTVLDGTEAVVLNPNPWDVLALELRRRIARQFNRAHFAEAAESAAEAAARVGERWRPLFLALKELCDGYDRWQSFDYPGADTLLNRSAAKLAQIVRAAGLDAFANFVGEIERDRQRLAILKPAFVALQRGDLPAEAAIPELVKDLAAQAERLCRLASRPDDGVARLYCAIEKLGKGTLAARGIDNSAARPEDIPEPLRAEFLARYADPVTGRLRFGLEASYRVLDALGDPLGERYRMRADELRKVLDVRNHSLLVHGWRPVSGDIFERMLALTLAFLGIRREELPALPVFPGS